MGRTWSALELSPREWDAVEDARRAAERKSGEGVTLTNKELLLLMANDTSAKWRKKA